MQCESCLEGDRRFHAEREAKKQRIAKAQRMHTKNIQNIVLHQKMAPPRTARRKRAPKAHAAQRQTLATKKGSRQGGRTGPNRRCGCQRSRFCSSSGPLSCNQTGVGSHHHAAQLDTGETAKMFLPVHQTAPSIVTRAPIMHQPSDKLQTPSTEVSNSTALCHGAFGHKDKPCPFPQSNSDAPPSIQPQQTGRRLRAFHVCRLRVFNDPH